MGKSKKTQIIAAAPHLPPATPQPPRKAALAPIDRRTSTAQCYLPD